MHPRTVRRALARGGAPAPRRRPRRSLLEPHRALVDQFLADGVWNAQVIVRELHARGDAGGISILRDSSRPERAVRPSRVTVRFETLPGPQLHSDWGTVTAVVGGVETSVQVSVNTLGYSRRCHFWCTDRGDAEHTDEGLIRSFEWCGGVPAEVLVDNQKSTVLVHRPDGVPFHPRFLDLAAHDGFRPRACRPRRARTKGTDERMGGYVAHHFFVRSRAFDRWAHLNQLAEQWLREEADQPVPGTVHEVVAERCARERPHLRPLPVTRYDTSYWDVRQVGWDASSDVRGHRDSVPARVAGRRVAMRIGLDGHLRVVDGDVLVAEHTLRPASQGWVTVPAHHQALWTALDVERRPLAVYEEGAQWS